MLFSKTFRTIGIAAAISLTAVSIDASQALAATSNPPPLTGGGPALTVTSYDTTITSFDGTQIAATVFVPNAPANTPVPLVVHSNGWGAQRMHQLDPKGYIQKIFYTQSEEAAKIANENGYFLISYDERGWNQSTGVDELMSAAYNGKDFQAVLDWAEANLGPQLARRNGQLVVGTLGYSYGGGFQLLGASLDSRVVAMVPALTWHSFPNTLGPGLPTFQPRTTWAAILQLAAEVFSNENPLAKTAFPDVEKNGSASTYIPALFDYAAANGPNAYCDAGFSPAPGQSVPTAATYLVQGWQDTLFRANEAYDTENCLRAQPGSDVRVLIQQYGHTIPFSVWLPAEDGTIAIAMEENPHCGTQTFNLPQAMYSFIDQHIRGAQHAGPYVNIPQDCVTVDDNTGFVVNTLPTQGSTYTVASKSVSGTGSKATFVPLYTATASKAMAGIPQMSITITSSGSAPWAYFGIGIQRAGSKKFALLDQQVYPIQGTGTFKAELSGVSANLSKGDVVGIYASNQESQFAYSAQPSKMPGYSFSGSFTLPAFVN